MAQGSCFWLFGGDKSRELLHGGQLVGGEIELVLFALFAAD